MPSVIQWKIPAVVEGNSEEASKRMDCDENAENEESPGKIIDSATKKYLSPQEDCDVLVSFFEHMYITCKKFPPNIQLKIKREIFKIVSNEEEKFISEL